MSHSALSTQHSALATLTIIGPKDTATIHPETLRAVGGSGMIMVIADTPEGGRCPVEAFDRWPDAARLVKALQGWPDGATVTMSAGGKKLSVVKATEHTEHTEGNASVSSVSSVAGIRMVPMYGR